MKNILLFVFTMLFFQNAYAQVGLSAGFKMMNASAWTDFLNQKNQSNSSNYQGISVGLDYWFRLEKKRIEFFPTLSYEKYQQNFGLSKDEINTLNFYFNTNIYFFDFEGDCNCPTFSKGGKVFEKGFFIQVSPGVSYFTTKFATATDDTTDKNLNFGLGIGAGLDIGISDFFTVTPLVRYTWLPSVTREELALVNELPNDALDTDISQFFVGIRLGLRWTD